MRELIQKGDPMLRVELPTSIVQALQASAKQNKRKVQDEIIKRLFKSFRCAEALSALQFDLLQQKPTEGETTEKWAQVIPLEMMYALNQASAHKNLSLGEEVLSRLLATLKYPHDFGFNALESAILHHEFSSQDALGECKRKHEAWMYIYEMEKLRLFLEFEAKLPRHVKENFMCIDVKAMSEKIRAELHQQEKKRCK